MVLGVSQASFIPVSSGALFLFYIKSVSTAGLVVGLLGWLLTRSLPSPRPATSNPKEGVDKATRSEK
jgi:hypothetical protein